MKIILFLVADNRAPVPLRNVEPSSQTEVEEQAFAIQQVFSIFSDIMPRPRRGEGILNCPRLSICLSIRPSHRCWPISRERKVLEIPNSVGKLPIQTGNITHLFQG